MNQTTSEKQEIRPSPREYNSFIRQVEIMNIRIIAARVDLLDYSYFPSSAEVTWRMAASYENAEDQFNVSHRYRLVVKDKESKRIKARISVTFYVAYSSKIPITDDLFEVFKKINLPLNTWPYFREFVHNTATRMGWPPFVAPAYKPS
jgi:hypothetical protein